MATLPGRDGEPSIETIEATRASMSDFYGSRESLDSLTAFEQLQSEALLPKFDDIMSISSSGSMSTTSTRSVVSSSSAARTRGTRAKHKSRIRKSNHFPQERLLKYHTITYPPRSTALSEQQDLLCQRTYIEVECYGCHEVFELQPRKFLAAHILCPHCARYLGGYQTVKTRISIAARLHCPTCGTYGDGSIEPSDAGNLTTLTQPEVSIHGCNACKGLLFTATIGGPERMYTCTYFQACFEVSITLDNEP